MFCCPLSALVRPSDLACFQRACSMKLYRIGRVTATRGSSQGERRRGGIGAVVIVWSWGVSGRSSGGGMEARECWCVPRTVFEGVDAASWTVSRGCGIDRFVRGGRGRWRRCGVRFNGLVGPSAPVCADELWECVSGFLRHLRRVELFSEPIQLRSPARGRCSRYTPPPVRPVIRL